MPVEEGDSDDSDYWDTSGDESSESSSGDDEGQIDWRKKFLKDKDKDDEKDKKDKKAKKGKERIVVKETPEEDGDWTKVERTLDKPKMFEKDAEINHDLVIKKLHEIMAARGKKRTNRKEQIDLLSELLDISNEKSLGVGVATKIQFAIVAAIFDYNPKISVAMKPEYWERCMPAVEELLRLIEENKDTLQTGEFILEEQEKFEEAIFKVFRQKFNLVFVWPDKILRSNIFDVYVMCHVLNRTFCRYVAVTFRVWKELMKNLSRF